MNQIFLVFLSVLADHIHNRASVLPESADTVALAELAALAQRQECGGIVFVQTQLPELKASCASLTYYALNRKQLLNKLHASLTEAGIPYLIFKGCEVAQYYPKPELRNMGDIDLLVHQSDRPKAGELLEQLGFHLELKTIEDMEWIYEKGNWSIELHHRLLYDEDLFDRKYNAYTDTVWRRCRVFRMKEEGYRIKGTGETSTEPEDHKNAGVDVQHHLEPEFHFVYLLLHLQKHFLWGGIRLRQFLDLAMMMKNCPMDWNRIEADLTELGQLNFAKVCFALIERWFGVTSPVGCAEISEEFYGSTTETILGDCIFVDPENANKVDMTVMNEVQKERAGFLKRLKMMLNVLFPPYEQLRAKYPEMAVSPLLLPLLWLRRFMEAVLHKQASKRLSFAAKPLTMNKELKEREALLKQWGL